MDHIPSFADGIDYWSATPATVEGVLGGFGPSTPVPLVDESSSRILILSLFPSLSIISTPSTASNLNKATRRSYRALDAGAGIGRVTSNVLLPFFDRIDLVEPVTKFLERAKSDGSDRTQGGWKLLNSEGTQGGKSVRMWKSGLQFFDPSKPSIPLAGGSVEHFTTLIPKVKASTAFPDPSLESELKDGYDLMMLQWCLGHLSNVELVEFFKRCQKCLRVDETGKVAGFIIAKENTCKDDEGEFGEVFDVGDSSITRSDKSFRRIFKEAGLKLVKFEVQRGFPAELFPVISYVLV